MFNQTFLGRIKSVRHASYCVLILALCFAYAPLQKALAQSTGTLDGIVHDPTGAVIIGASVQLKDVHSGVVRSTQSNSTGVFSYSGVPSGDYLLRISANGFHKEELTGIHMNPGDQRSFRNIALVVAAQADESVTVTANVGGQLNTDSGESSSMISQEDIKHLAIEGRDVSELLKILPGMSIVQSSSTMSNSSYDPSIVAFSGAIGSYAANGTQTNSTAMLNDGMDITDPGSYGIAIQNVNYDQVAEVKVQTGSFTADAAHGPILINAVGRAGGASFHGSIYTYGRTHQMNTGDWFAKYTGSILPQDRQLYPGFTLGGPVLIPGTRFNHDKKLTFFVGAEEYAQRKVYAYGSASQALVTALVPTLGMRNGDFGADQLALYLGSSYQPNAKGACTNLYSNICSVPTGADGSTLSAAQMNAAAAANDPSGLGKFILNVLPKPNMASNGTYNYISTDFVNSNLLQVHGRVDYAVSERTKAFISYGIERGKQYQPANPYGRFASNGMGNQQDLPGGGFVDMVGSHVASMNITTIINPSLTNEFYAGGAYFSQPFKMKNAAATQYSSPYSFVFNNGSKTMPTLATWGGYDGLPMLNVEDGSLGTPFTAKQLRMGGDNVTKVWKRHTFRAGAFYQWVINPQSQQGQATNGSISDYYHGWRKSFTDSTGASRFITGNYLADNYIGIIGGFSQTNKKLETTLYFSSIAGYFQDHWLVSSHLSIDAGLRLEHLGPWTDAHGVGVAIFDAKAYANGTPSSSPGVLYHAIDSSVPLSGVSTRPVFYEPRIGFAYDPRGNASTVIRGGFGFYRQHESYNDAMPAAQTGAGVWSYSTSSSPNLFSTLNTLQNSATNASGFTKDATITVRMRNDDEMPYVMTYNLMVDQHLAHHAGFEIGYVGNNANHLTESSGNNINALAQGALFGAQPNSRPDTASTAGQYFPFFAPASATSSTNTAISNLDTAHIDSYRKYPLYNSIKTIGRIGYSNYNGLQAAMFWQPKHGNFSANYTFAKALGAITGPDPVNIHNDYKPLNIDRRHILNFTYSYDLGQMVKQRYLGWVVNDWEVAGITGMQGGTELTSTLGSNFNVTGTITVPVGTTASTGTTQSVCQASSTTAAQTCTVSVSSQNIVGSPDYTLQPTLVGNPHGKKHQQYVDGSVFRLPVVGSNGPNGYGSLRGPLFFNSDLNMSKVFRIGEGKTLQLRGAAFNFLNRANNTFSNSFSGMYTMNYTQTSADTTMSSVLSDATNQQTQFGSTNLRTGRRVMEISARYNF